ncbi:unnamed protein product [Oppiella nova]|uniref:Protein kinase domain-containing protein n=1 Tax=Oppiella nova TaxID=334625 RepID=A0A7R9LW03_9ACAR|nr:unnamed protein product [Oppiella nova]CAG2167209.1 unnamed protein product [Oppiella nova]
MCYILQYLCFCCEEENETKLKRKKRTERRKKLMNELTHSTPKWPLFVEPNDIDSKEMTEQIYRVPQDFKTVDDVFKDVGYEITGQLGEGGFATVLKARHIEKHLRVAVKRIVIPVELTGRRRQTAITDIKNELFVLRTCRHPHVIQMMRNFTIVSFNEMTIYVVMQLAKNFISYVLMEFKGRERDSRHPTMRPYILPIVLATCMANTNGQYIDKTTRHTIDGSVDCFDSKSETIYEYKFETIDGKKNVSMSEYRNHTLLITNQEPGADAQEIMNGLKYVRPGNGYEPKYIYTKKIEVNGQNEDPLFSYLKRSCPTTQHDFASRESLFYDKLYERDIRWNFELFLIHPLTGKPVKRYDASYDPMKTVDDIKKIIDLHEE